MKFFVIHCGYKTCKEIYFELLEDIFLFHEVFSKSERCFG